MLPRSRLTRPQFDVARYQLITTCGHSQEKRETGKGIVNEGGNKNETPINNTPTKSGKSGGQSIPNTPSGLVLKSHSVKLFRGQSTIGTGTNPDCNDVLVGH